MNPQSASTRVSPSTRGWAVIHGHHASARVATSARSPCRTRTSPDPFAMRTFVTDAGTASVVVRVRNGRVNVAAAQRTAITSPSPMTDCLFMGPPRVGLHPRP